MLNTLFLASLVSFVDPFVGTAGTGHTTPAALAPLGMIQAGPDTGNSDWAHASGYVYGDTNVWGFSQTHLSGTGCGDFGDVRILPFVGETVPTFLPYDKKTEESSPGFYSVMAGNVRTMITATPHVAFYRISYPKAEKARLLVDTQWGVGTWNRGPRRVLSSAVSLEGRTGVSGTLAVHQWSKRIYSFYLQFNRPFVAVEELPRARGERAPRYVFDFDLKAGEPLLVKIALSQASPAKAKLNLEKEVPNWDWSHAWREVRASWEKFLSRARIEGTDDAKKNWYTSLYHLYTQPNRVSDVDEPIRFSTFSTWDTFRAAGPFYTLLTPHAANDFVHSMLQEGRANGFLPIWSLWGSDNQCMIGTHSVPMIVDAILKGIYTGSADEAFDQIKETLTKPHPKRRLEQWDLLDRYGYYPFDLVPSESVSRTLECSYDDYCAARLAEKLGKKDDAAFFMKRASNWTNVIDSSIGFARAKDSKGAWRDPFNPFAIEADYKKNDFTEGNSFQYTWHVLHDVPALVAALGGRDKTIEKLDALFRAPSVSEGMSVIPDISGLIGQYIHGNEPSHHVIYLYSLLGERNKAAERIRDVFDRFYDPRPDGLCGNDDCGQMSAWYLFSAMGFYPVNPCGGEYVLGAPQVEKVTLQLENKKTFTVEAKNFSKDHLHVKSVSLNGQVLTSPILRHDEILAGGTLVFEME